MPSPSFEQIAKANLPYLSQWYARHPAVVSFIRYREFEWLQKLLYRAILFFQEHYFEYEHIFPQSEAAKRILHICKPHPYKMGSYRPDFLIDKEGNVKICEIGTRFPLNGYFSSAFATLYGQLYFPAFQSDHSYQIKHLVAQMHTYWKVPIKEICVLKGVDKPCDIKYYVPFFEKEGFQVMVRSPQALSKDSSVLQKKVVINEFNQMEMMELDDHTLEAIAQSNALNDMRTTFLIHDKRFLAVLNHNDFTSRFFTEQERTFLAHHIIPTFTALQAPCLWHQARVNKEKWLIKHCLLGKSEKVFAGPLCNTKEWDALFKSDDLHYMVLQPLIQQKRVSLTVGGSEHNDFITGMLLCFNNSFLGPGIFRASSYEITNRADDRKVIPLVADGIKFDGGINL